MSDPDLAAVASSRARLWDCGFRPVPVYTVEAGRRAGHDKPGKHPAGAGWQLAARRDPPTAALALPDRDTANTGILCDGLRVVDLDIDNATLAHRCTALAREMLGEAPTRFRANSPRRLLVYRAAEGEPPKKSLAGTLGKIEVLGRGQQFVAFGDHESGTVLQWHPEPLGSALIESIPAVTEEQIDAFLARCAEIIGAKPPRQQGNGEHRSGSEAHAESLRIAAALNAIPNSGTVPDWERWNYVGMAVWRATGGSAAGFEAWNAWSARNASYSPERTKARWDHYAKSPPTKIGAGTIFHLAYEATFPSGGGEGDPWDEPPGEPPPSPTENPDDQPYVGLLEYLSIDGWLSRELPKPDRLLGDLLTTTSRMFLVGPTGIGKSMLAMAGGVALTAERDFLHWPRVGAWIPGGLKDAPSPLPGSWPPMRLEKVWTDGRIDARTVGWPSRPVAVVLETQCRTSSTKAAATSFPRRDIG